MSPSVGTTISAQPGPQTEFLRTAADICIYGGAAGGGETGGLILEATRPTGGVRRSLRPPCPPGGGGGVAGFRGWWMAREPGLPTPKRAGVLRYYMRVSEKIVWPNRPEDLTQPLPPQTLPLGVDPPRP